MARRSAAKKPRTARGTRKTLRAIGVIRSTLVSRAEAPRQGREGAPDAWLDIRPSLAEGLDGISVGDEILVVTWLHQARREVLKVRPRDDMRRPLTGVFATRSPDRPNPLGLHPVTVKEIVGNAPADRADRGHRRHAGRRRETGAL